jgi:hypothetical protein
MSKVIAQSEATFALAAPALRGGAYHTVQVRANVTLFSAARLWHIDTDLQVVAWGLLGDANERSPMACETE